MLHSIEKMIKTMNAIKRDYLRTVTCYLYGWQKQWLKVDKSSKHLHICFRT